jgi:hypothetical protein
LKKRGAFLADENNAVKTPRQPHKPPHLHHQNTTPKDAFFLKTPRKNAISPDQKKISGENQNLGSRLHPNRPESQL